MEVRACGMRWDGGWVRGMEGMREERRVLGENGGEWMKWRGSESEDGRWERDDGREIRDWSG